MLLNIHPSIQDSVITALLILIWKKKIDILHFEKTESLHSNIDSKLALFTLTYWTIGPDFDSYMDRMELRIHRR